VSSDLGLLGDELSHAGAEEQIRVLYDRADVCKAEQPGDTGSDPELDLGEDVDRTDPAEVAFWVDYLIDAGAPEPVTSLIGPDLPPYLVVGYPESVLELLRALERAGAKRHILTLAKRAVAEADLISHPELSGRVLSILLKAGASEQTAQLIGQDPAGRADLSDPRAVAGLLDSLREARADAQVAALLARNPAQHAVLGEGGGGSLVWALYNAGAEAQANWLNALLPDAGEFDAFCDFEYGDDTDHIYRYGREPDGSPTSPWGWADLP
jgi:hypothetical protein